MIYFLTSQPIWLSGVLVVGLGTLLSMLGPALVRRYVGIKRLTANNEVAGFKFATIGVLYAVLLAFAIIVVWQKFSDAEVDVVHEAGAAENIYRLSQGLTDKGGIAVRDAVANYLKVTIDNDWPAMDRGTAGAGGAPKQALDAIYAALLSSNAQSNGAVVSEMLRQLELITQARRARLVASQGAVPNVIWLVLLGGAAITIGFTFFFGAEILRAQVVMTAFLAMLIFSELLIVIAIDRPFTGTVKVEPNALAAVLADLESRSGSSPGQVAPEQK
ncbi:MAG: DUF4239 domain-containing protein [Xanthobacteraceae bacterium]